LVQASANHSSSSSHQVYQRPCHESGLPPLCPTDDKVTFPAPIRTTFPSRVWVEGPPLPDSAANFTWSTFVHLGRRARLLLPLIVPLLRNSFPDSYEWPLPPLKSRRKIPFRMRHRAPLDPPFSYPFSSPEICNGPIN